MADTELQQLVINVGTTAQIEAGISGGTITQDMLSISTDGPDYATGPIIVNLSATDSITLANNTLYKGGTQTALTIALPSTLDVDFITQITFKSGATATTFTAPQSGFVWDARSVDLQQGAFVPVANKVYTIIIYYDGFECVGIIAGQSAS